MLFLVTIAGLLKVKDSASRSMKPPPPPMARTKAAGESTGRAAASMTGALSGCRTATE